MGTSGHLGRDGADCEGVCVGAFDACQTVASQGRGERQRSFFFQDEEKTIQSNSAPHGGMFAFCKIDRI